MGRDQVGDVVAGEHVVVAAQRVDLQRVPSGLGVEDVDRRGEAGDVDAPVELGDVDRVAAVGAVR